MLLKGSSELNDFCYGGAIYTDPVTGQLQTKPSNGKEKIKNIEQFTDAFMIFMSIYLKRFPNDAIPMLQYIKILRTAAYTSPGNGWINYDEQFRLRKAINPNAPWGELKSALWLTTVGSGSYNYHNSNNYNTGVQQNTQQQKIQLPCFDYNSGQCSWRNCKYLHVCALCKMNNHVEANCPSQTTTVRPPVVQRQAATPVRPSLAGQNQIFRPQRPFRPQRQSNYVPRQNAGRRF